LEDNDEGGDDDIESVLADEGDGEDDLVASMKATTLD